MTFILALAAAGMASAQSASVVVEKVDNQGLVEGDTYRVYVKAPSIDHSVHALFADGVNTLTIESTAPFYQNVFGSHTSTGQNAAIVAIQPELSYDSYVTIGAASDANNNLWEAGVNPAAFEAGESLHIEDGAWFVIPTDQQANPNQEKLVLVAQLTTTGEAHGVLNVQGWDGDRNTWQTTGLEFNTKNAITFGSNEDTADNTGNSQDNAAAVTASTDAADSFQVFPNPVRDNQINIQFNSNVDFESGNLAVDVLDLSGKVVYTTEVSAATMTAGNRMIISTELASGVYTITIRQGAQMNVSQQVIVQH